MHGQAERYPGRLKRGLGEGADLRSVGVVKGGADKKQKQQNNKKHTTTLGLAPTAADWAAMEICIFTVYYCILQVAHNLPQL